MSRVDKWRNKYRESLPETKAKLLSLLPLLALPLLGMIGVWEALGFPPWGQGPIGGLIAGTLYVSVLTYAYVEDIHSKIVEVEADTESIEDTVENVASFGHVYEYDDDDYFDDGSIVEEIDETPDRSILIEYSSNKGQKIRDKLLKQEGEVYLFLKFPQEAIDAGGETPGDQEATIVSEFKQLLKDNPDYLEELTVVFYTAPASVRARLVGDEELFIGWYHFEGEDGQQTIWGHCDPMLHVEHNHGSFESLRNFIEGMVAPRLWETAIFPAELVDENTDIETPQWVTEKFGEDAAEQFQTVSPDHADFEKEFGVEIEEMDPAGYQEIVERTE